MINSGTEIKVNSSSNYSVFVGTDLLSQCGKILSSILPKCRIAIISDTNVAPLYLDKVTTSLRASGYDTTHFVFKAGEPSKSIETLSFIWEFLASSELTRGDCIVALGGGVVGDVAGFAAATYLRGIPCVQMPTSLLAAVDSSVGGKTAIDLAHGKNLAGVFSQPLAVICDVLTLATLPSSFVSDGASECIKYGILGNKNILEFFKSNDLLECIDNMSSNSSRRLLIDLISESVKMKADFVKTDEFDKGQRMYLNLGHTIGHAIEKKSNYTVPHGHAVAIGMVIVSSIGENLGITKPGTAASIASILYSCGLPTNTTYELPELFSALVLDKKRNGDKITLVIPEYIGQCTLMKFTLEELEDVLIAQ